MPEKQPKQKKQRQKAATPVMLKQYLVTGSPAGASTAMKAALIAHTCPKLANEEFARRFPGCSVWSTQVAAQTGLTKEDAEGRDLWAEGHSWVLLDRASDDEPAEHGA